MKNRKYNSGILLFICLLAFSISGCTAVDMDHRSEEELGKISLLLTTRALDEVRPGTNNENEINTLRAIVFKTIGSDNSMTYGTQILNTTITAADAIRLSIDKGEAVRVFLIANEGDLPLSNRSLSVADLRKMCVTYNSHIKSPLLMFGESRTFSGIENETGVVQMERNVARIDLTLTCSKSDLAQLNNGKLHLTEARVNQMAPKAGLGEVYANIAADTKPEEYLTSSKIDFAYTPQADGSFTTNTLTFYVPEHVVNSTDLYTYISIKGEFHPNSGGTAIPVEYHLPVGENITTPKLTSGFSTADLRINRNHLYDMKANIKSLQQISEVHVKVTPWVSVDVNGSINEDTIYRLNVSDLKPTLQTENGKETFVQFWSNLPAEDIRVLATGYIKENNETFNTNDVFVSLSGKDATNFEIKGDSNKKEQWGHLSLQFKKDSHVMIGKTYVITLAAGVLQRTIEVEAIATDAFKIENTETEQISK